MTNLSRRRFLTTSSSFAMMAGAGLAMPAISRANQRPTFTHGVQSGDVDMTSGMVWARADRPSQVMFEISTREDFSGAVKLPPLFADPASDFAVKRLVTGLAPNQDIFYRLQLVDLQDSNSVSEPIIGGFRTAPSQKRNIRFAWSGDTAGQGWGIDDDGMVTYETMAKHSPDFFIHSGDTVYADGPMKDEVELSDGSIWKNTTLINEKRKVAETLDEFRGQWKYNLMDRHVQALNAICPTFMQWDDHEVVNNWSASKDLTSDDRYTVKSVPLLQSRASRAFHEMTPLRFTPAEPGRVYRKISYGPSLDVFFLDLRSYRGPNGASMETALTAETRIMGERQLAWLKQALKASTATWKVIASDMPIGLIVWDNWAERKGAEAIANGDHGPASGRELEIAELLKFIKTESILNTVWFTADVHYTAAHYYDPSKARFQDFEPFWEFVSGPLHAGTFGPGELDMTFGPELKYAKAPTAEQGPNLPPSAGLQFFGLV
ncbi:MAG: alkaline phosphatase D family protein, partial [Hyphomicrobiales bacterium]|nr:alkaline phosphatase D family protein [Hyphomicrobiales bacterium]